MAGIPTLGPTRVTMEAAQAWARARGAHARFIDIIIPLLYKYAPMYNVPAESLCVQSSHETNYGKYTGVVPHTYKNPGGIKTKYGGGNYDPKAHQQFDSWEHGCEAKAQHVAKYGGNDTIPEGRQPHSPRLHLITTGSAPYIRDLGGKYAPSPTYGTGLEAKIQALIDFARERGGLMSGEDVATRYGIRGLIDSRDKTYRHGFWNPSRRRPLSEKRGVIIHYAGGNQPISTNTDMQLWQSYASPKWGHAAPGRFGSGITADGLQYQIGIGRDGSKHLLTDIELDRWHCGAWPENGVALAINLPIGGSQHATPEALQALTEVVDDWIAGGHGDRSMVKGHQEVDGTSCPGTLMEDFVLPYREGVVTTEEGRWFPDTKCYIGGGFWDYWINNGGLMIFGLPLTNETDEGGRTVQYFERAVFEFHPENKDPYRVLLRRLGAEALARTQEAA